MARRTQSEAGGDYEQPEWDEDKLYPVHLKEISELYPEGSIGPKGQPRKSAAMKVIWQTEDEYEAWIFDTISLTTSFTGSGVPSKCLQIMCALAGKDPVNCGEPWIDDASLEFGFTQPGGKANADNWPVEGQIALGDRVQVRGRISPGREGRTFLNPERYRPATAQQAAATPAAHPAQAPEPIYSEDRQWMWDNDAQQWVPAA